MPLEQLLEEPAAKSLYHRLADKVLTGLSEQLEQGLCNVDVDYRDGSLQFQVAGVGEYVFNKQPSVMQIWASSPITGPRRFDISRRHEWVDLRNHISLSQYIEEEVGKIRRKLSS